ncbi:OLC1v1026344C1 [Oldenlandia corymbosa var. corymbosa]|uniref:OLC1v1026344C1 n=1 Tax=Oldenlandia corymbosa var. corymbosa TaxID=529605 RepID=A0AAV1C749_OLDCO|nr:OLC1v1026344C1 [Oldenlandia corymbosa var. corymbosa]
MEKQNADLFWENCRIMLANEKLKKKVEKLMQENQMLAAEVRMRIEPENPNNDPQDGNRAESSSSANNWNKNQGKGKNM